MTAIQSQDIFIFFAFTDLDFQVLELWGRGETDQAWPLCDVVPSP